MTSKVKTKARNSHRLLKFFLRCNISLFSIFPEVSFSNRITGKENDMHQKRIQEPKPEITPSSGDGIQVNSSSMLDSYEFNLTLLQSAPYPMVVTGRDTSIQYVNPAFENLSGFTRDELIGQKSPYPWWPPEKLQEYTKANAPGRRKELNKLERCYQKKNGEVFWVVLYIAPVRGKGDTQYFIGNYVDITERRRAEQEAEHLRQIMTHISRVNDLGEIATSLAHELNQPLTAIMANARAALRMMESGIINIGETKGILEDIYADGQRAGDIVRRMREPLKRGSPALEVLDLNSLIKEIYRLVRNDAALSGVTIELKPAPGLPKVKGDRTQLRQVVLNLVINALDSVKETVSGRKWIEICCSAHTDKTIKVEISDSGPGISEGSRQHLFEPFYTTKPDGLGVGLSISRNLVEAHGGRIWQENQAEGGSRFVFTLPVDRKSILTREED
jgi:two-component system, LuxR family, sensor kinase FixL